jgi:hypothetical protein
VRARNFVFEVCTEEAVSLGAAIIRVTEQAVMVGVGRQIDSRVLSPALGNRVARELGDSIPTRCLASTSAIVEAILTPSLRQRLKVRYLGIAPTPSEDCPRSFQIPLTL